MEPGYKEQVAYNQVPLYLESIEHYYLTSLIKLGFFKVDPSSLSSEREELHSSGSFYVRMIERWESIGRPPLPELRVRVTSLGWLI